MQDEKYVTTIARIYLLKLNNSFTLSCSVSVVNFGQVNAGWDINNHLLILYQTTP